ncbi:MAG: hypothetical protein IRZ16_13670 [Myxococcaceae bacterium]|nr:hypothetical protein [Myxococcaceae bacterium]
MIRSLLFGALACALVSAPVFAQEEDDAPIPYIDEEVDSRPTDDRGLRELPRSSEGTPDLRDETWVGEEDGDVSLARLDDPNKGVGGSVVAGLMLLDSSQGRFAEPRFAWGLRFTWEYGRLIPADPWHDALFADVGWTWGTLHDGTARIFADSHYHYFTLAPAYELHVDAVKSFGFFAQLGAGLAYQSEAIQSDGQITTIAGVKPLFQYGIGVRGRPVLREDPMLRLVWRLELTRFRRGYMDDTLIAASVGADF